MTAKYYFTAAIITLSLLNVHGQYDSIRHNNSIRTYLLHLPSGYSTDEPLPLIIAMHGGFGSAYNIENQSQLSEKADAENFIVVYPEGVKGGVLNIRTWNAGECCGFASRSNIDDVGFIDALLDTLIRYYPVDTSRIYATGMSNGGFMAYRLACELFHRIAAIAPVAASMNLEECTPVRPVPIIAFHSYLDENVPYDGGVGNGFSDHYNPSQESVMKEWSDRNGCSSVKDTAIDDERLTFVKWTLCKCSSEIHHYATKDGGHSWPGGRQTFAGDPPSAYVNANDLMWEFFQRFSIDCETSGLKPQNDNEFRIYPNPATGFVYIRTGSSNKNFRVRVADDTGKILKHLENQHYLDLTGFPAGIYFVSVSCNEGTIIRQKLVLR